MKFLQSSGQINMTFLNKLKSNSDICDAVTTDGMTLASTLNKYYDFNIHYYIVSTTSFATSPISNLTTQLLCLERHN